MKCPGELFDALLPDAVLYVQVVLGHVDVRMTDDALDGRQIHAESLHLRHVGVSAGMGRQHPHTGDLGQSLFEVVAESGGLQGLSFFRISHTYLQSVVRSLTAQARTLSGTGTSR